MLTANRSDGTCPVREVINTLMCHVYIGPWDLEWLSEHLIDINGERVYWKGFPVQLV